MHLRHGRFGLCEAHKWRPRAATIVVQTDASPFGEELQGWDFQLFGSVRGDPAFQSEYELLAMLVALRVFARQIYRAGALQVAIRGDNTSTLHTALTYVQSRESDHDPAGSRNFLGS